MRHAAARGIAWTFFNSTFVRVLQILTMLALAKLLMPADFGVFALATMVTNGMTIFSDTGFAQALIYRQGDIRKGANTAFVLCVATNMTLGTLALVAAPLIGRAFTEPHIVAPLRLMALGLMAWGAASVPMALLDKELLFKKRAVVEIAGAVCYSAIAVVLALLHFSYWSMVIAWTVSVALNMTVVWLVSPWRPTLQFSREESRAIISYGKHLVAGVVVTFIVFQLDKAAVGKMLGVGILGCYTVAFTVCSLPATNLTAVVNRVMFPTYSRLHDDLPAIRKVYLGTIKHLAIVAFPITAGLVILAGPAIRLFYGVKWYPAIPLFHILAFYGMMRAIGATAETVFMATGQTKLVRQVSLIQLAVGGIFVYPVTRFFGVQGVAVLFTLAYAAGTLYGLYNVQKILDIGLPGWLASLRAPTIASAVAAAIAGAVFVIAGRSTLPVLILVGTMLGCAYGVSMLTLDRSAFVDLKAFMALRSGPGGGA